MSRNLIVKRNEFSDLGGSFGCGMRKRTETRKGSVKVKTAGMIFISIFVVAILGIIYLYQVNDLATKGYEVKEIEKEIMQLKKDNEENKIREVELRSMYNVEKATKDFNLVNSENISYLEIKSSVAMK